MLRCMSRADMLCLTPMDVSSVSIVYLSSDEVHLFLSMFLYGSANIAWISKGISYDVYMRYKSLV